MLLQEPAKAMVWLMMVGYTPCSCLLGTHHHVDWTHMSSTSLL
jgi:hypothetical protein